MKWQFAIYALMLAAPSPARTKMNTDECLARFNITVRVAHKEIPPAKGAAVRILEEVRLSSREGRLAGLPDDLNPVIVDAAKVEAFLASLPNVPAGSLSRLQGRILYLNDSALQLHSASAVTVQTLKSGFGLQAADGPPGKIASVRLQAQIDKSLARDTASRAKQTMETVDREVQSLEPKRAQGGADIALALSIAQSKRSAAATVWRDLIAALASLDPGDTALQAEAAAATGAANRFRVAPWSGGMPGR